MRAVAGPRLVILDTVDLRPMALVVHLLVHRSDVLGCGLGETAQCEISGMAGRKPPEIGDPVLNPNIFPTDLGGAVRVGIVEVRSFR